MPPPTPTIHTVSPPLSSPGTTGSGPLPITQLQPPPQNKDFNLLKESNNNKQVPVSNTIPPIPPSAQQPISKKELKDSKRKSLKDKLTQLPRKKEVVHRTIDRLQPGKAKGNLLTNIQNINKPEELFPLGNPNKVKEIKNSLIVKTSETGPKLSLGTVLDTEDFGLGQQHSFNDGKEKDKPKTDENDSSEEKEKKEENPVQSSLAAVLNPEVPEIKEPAKSDESKDASKVANLGAWFKAFGVTKKPKKPEDEENGKNDLSESMASGGESSKISDILPGPQRQRRMSTGSTTSERSSFSQDPDSPRIAIDERIGAPAPYPSPIGASPIMASPRTDDLQKIPAGGATPSYQPNGSIRVGFYQDMISTKSSPEKSCSPREMPSPYPQYSNMYPGSSPSPYWNNHPGATTPDMPPKTPTYSKQTASPASTTYYDQYKQPMSQESDFNSSMSPTTNPNSPYHSQQSSPYQQQPNSPYQQSFQQQKNNASNSAAPATPGASHEPHSPYSQPNSPYSQPSNHIQAPQPQPQSQQLLNEVSIYKLILRTHKTFYFKNRFKAIDSKYFFRFYEKSCFKTF